MSELWRAKQTAKFLDMSVSQIYAMANRGELPSVRFGPHAVRFPADLIREWLEKRIMVGEVVK